MSVALRRILIPLLVAGLAISLLLTCFYPSTVVLRTPDWLRPPTRPPTVAANPAKTPSNAPCEPFTHPFHIHLNSSSPSNSFIRTYDPKCPAPSGRDRWLARLKLAVDNSESLDEFKNKELLAIGDSIDRYLIVDTCAMLNAEVKIHPLHSYTEVEGPEVTNGGLPRSCYIPSLNLTLANWFFYGFDEKDMWTDKFSTYTPPGEFSKRWPLFTAAVKTLPSGGRPDAVLLNVGLWELARYDRQYDFKDGREPDPPIVDDEFEREYIEHLTKFLPNVRRVVGNGARIVWRQMHTSSVNHGPYFKNADGDKKNGRARFHGVKVHQLNEVAKGVIDEYVAEHEAGREGFGGWSWFAIGDAISPWKGGWMRDDIHPTPTLGPVLWMEGILDFLSRAHS